VLARQDGPTVLAGHSFSGMIVTDAGVHPNVSAVVYVAARAPDAGEDYAALAKKAVASHPAANGHTAGAVDVTVADLDAEAGTGIAGAALRHDLDGPSRPSNDVRARALSVAEAATIATVMRVETIESVIIFMVANLDNAVSPPSTSVTPT
jgi:pimeloyl-ACP methyl ester carboxylesterase